MPFWSDNNLLFLAGKGDGNIRYYEYESDTLHELPEHKPIDPQRGMCFLPRRALEVTECKLMRAYQVYGSTIEPIAFVVPRKSDQFQSDIFPSAPSSEPALTAGEFFSAKTAPPNLSALLLVTAAPAPAPVSVPAPVSKLIKPPTPASVPIPQTPASVTDADFAAEGRGRTDGSAVERDENARLTSELREARAQIRNFELQVETMRANLRAKGCQGFVER
ncbi:Coronin-like protein crn1 [Ceratobasidium sp. 392]|nr:Coronin-like protein crn1 [Ceratobasidium sp. 392]